MISAYPIETKWSGRGDLNARPPAPKAGALPGCATPRLYSLDSKLLSSSAQAERPSCGKFLVQPVNFQGDYWGIPIGACSRICVASRSFSKQ